MKVTSKASQNLAGAESVKNSKVSPESMLDTKKSGKEMSAADLSSSSKVDVSPRAQTIKKAKELATPDNAVDEAKVARLQKMIDEGKYKMDAEAIADRLVNEHSMLS